MTWYLLVPLAVLVILPLFGFIGCGFSPAAYDPGAYGPTIMRYIWPGGLLAAWGERHNAGAQQRRRRRRSKGSVQRRLSCLARHDRGRAAPFALHRRQDRPGRNPGLLTDNQDAPDQSKEPCIQVDGGYVQIPANDALKSFSLHIRMLDRLDRVRRGARG